jgi:FkbM family methyltransferase
MRYTEYSQDNQDSFLDINVFDGFENGFFVDVGAHDGISYNNTYNFEKAYNWTGMNIEANPDIYLSLVKNRPSCINLSCAVSNKEGTAEFYKNTGHTEMLSGLVEHYDSRHKERLIKETSSTNSTMECIQVPTKRLASLLEEYKIGHIHYLSIDVEGAEYHVLQSIDFNKVNIDVIGYEVNYKDKGKEILEYLQTKGYRLLFNKSLDTFVIHKDSIFIKNVKRFLQDFS